ncbi:MAG: sulfur carrier protein ThiS [Pirellulaceae bacterium]|nr:sulfur carrier protein ThiS [Pirellulaceae bacterium]
MLTITINGEPNQVAVGCTIEQLLASFEKRGGPVAVERNAELVPSSEHATTELQSGDKLEVVSLTGGG